MTDITLSDILAHAYQPVERPSEARADTTALLLVDVQHLASPAHLRDRAVAAGMAEGPVNAALADYAGRFDAAVANCSRLLEAARQASVPCIHVKIEALAGNARDTGPAHRRMGWCYPPGSKESQFLPEVAPLPGEITISKTVSGAFTATSLDSVLRHMGVEWLIVAGFETDECIEATGRVALDLGYMAWFAADACTAYEADSHEHFMAKYDSWGLVRSTDWLISLLKRLGATTPPPPPAPA